MDVEQVRWVAHLSRLKLTNAELAGMAAELTSILAYVDHLRTVDTTGVEPLAHPLDVTGVFRDDEPTPSLGADAALANAPIRRDDFFGVPAVLD